MKLTTIQEDYVYNTIKALETQFDDVMEGLKEIHGLSEEGFGIISERIASMVMDAAITEEEKLKMTVREQRKVFSEIQEEIKEVFNKEYELQKKMIQDKLLTEAINYKLYKDFTLNGEFGFDPMQDMDKFLKVVNKEVNGADWSKRLWKAKQNTMRDLNKAVKDLGKGYITLSEVKKRIKKYNSNNNYAVNRLVRNELVRVQSEINEEFDKENGIEYQLFMATLDSKTTDICRNLDGKSFKIDDKNKPIPPNGTHIQCRSTLIGIPDKNWRPSTRRDNETGEIISYKAWKKENEVKIEEKKTVKRKPKQKKEAESTAIEELKGADSRYIESKSIKVSKKEQALYDKAEAMGMYIDKALDLHPEILKSIVEYQERTLERFPKLKEYPINILKDPNINKKHGGYFMPNGNNIYLNHHILGRKTISPADLSDGGYNSWYSLYDTRRNMIFAHEYGHFVMEVMLREQGKKNISSNIYKKYATELRKEVIKMANDREVFRVDINHSFFKRSEYLSTYGGTNAEESFAEAFQELTNYRKPREIPTLYGELIEKVLGGK